MRIMEREFAVASNQFDLVWRAARAYWRLHVLHGQSRAREMRQRFVVWLFRKGLMPTIGD